MIDFDQIANIFKDNNSFYITTHVNPDADAIGSEMAIYLILKRLGKEVKVVNYSKTPPFLDFLVKDEIIENFDFAMHSDYFLNCDVVIALDFSRADRTVKMSPLFYQRKKLTICIDHHLEPEEVFTKIYDDPGYAATCHIIYDLIAKTGITDLDYEISIPIYSGIATDTGNFRYDRTTPELHRIAATLLEKGVVPIEINDLIYGQDELSKFALLGRALGSLIIYGTDKRFAVMTLKQTDFIETGAEESDTEGFINICMTIKGVKLGAIFIELKEGFKVSLRGKRDYNVRDLAAHFGGGGHRQASGIRIRNHALSEKQDEIIHYILDNTTEVINNA